MSAKINEDIPEEFQKIIKDFISDVVVTFPEYEAFILKWWEVKKMSEFMERKQDEKMKLIFKHCLTVFPERFFDILYQNIDMFSDTSTVNTEFLPGISFKYLFKCDISEKTRETIWKYLQLILLSLVGSMDNKDAFGDTAKLFESINEDDFKGKLEETLEKMQNIFNGESNESSNNNESNENATRENMENPFNNINMNNLPNAEQVQDHISSMLGGKLGILAKEIAEETAEDLNIDMENITDAKGVFQNLFKNPGKLMSLVKNVGEKLDARIKSGDIKENELYSEATEMMNKMKNMPGLDNIQDLLKKMGMGGMANMPGMPNLGKNAKVDVNAMQQQFDRLDKNAKMKERLKQRAEMKNAQKIAAELSEKMKLNSQPIPSPQSVMSDDELIAFINGATNNNKKEKSQSSENSEQKKKGKKKGKK